LRDNNYTPEQILNNNTIDINALKTPQIIQNPHLPNQQNQ